MSTSRQNSGYRGGDLLLSSPWCTPGNCTPQTIATHIPLISLYQIGAWVNLRAALDLSATSPLNQTMLTEATVA